MHLKREYTQTTIGCLVNWNEIKSLDTRESLEEIKKKPLLLWTHIAEEKDIAQKKRNNIGHDFR